ncbi:MAG TPA: DUF4349 domain-containing protein [Gaiellaceae bacterium]
MSTPEIDERFDDLVRELRTLPGAPAELRDRVRELAAAPPPGRKRPRAGRLVLVVAVLALLGIAGVAAVYGLATSGGSSTEARRGRFEAAQTSPAEGGNVGAPSAAPKEQALTKRQPPHVFAPVTTTALGRADAATALPPTGTRLQEYSASMLLRVKGVDGLSRTTARAMRITRSLGGFVASVDYGTPNRKTGEAYLTVRIPNARVQQAVVKFSSLGVILSQQISIRDLQDEANHEAVQIIRLQREIDRLVAKLGGVLSPEERVQTQSQLDAARAALRARTEQHAGTLRRGRLAAFRLEFTTRKAAVVPVHHHKQGRIGRAASHAFSLLAKIVAGTIYGAIVLLPLFVLALLALVASRVLRRRGADRLLARA